MAQMLSMREALHRAMENCKKDQEAGTFPSPPETWPHPWMKGVFTPEKLALMDKRDN